MKNKGIILFLIILSLVMVVVLVLDWNAKRPDRMAPNKFKFDVEAFKNVPDELIRYKETRNFPVGFDHPSGMCLLADMIFLAGDRKCLVINQKGEKLKEIKLDEDPTRMVSQGGKVYMLFRNKVQRYDSELGLLDELEIEESDSYLTDLAADDGNIFVADAGLRKVYRYDHKWSLQNTLDGKAEDRTAHGFIIPSPYFDLELNPYGDLWIVNPGLHTLQNYTADGKLREHWKASGVQIENFSGCCNPAHFCFLPDGSFVTSEKGLVRIKIYKRSGEFEGVVAPPSVFEDKIEGQAPDVTCDVQGRIYALDLDKKMLRVFEER